MKPAPRDKAVNNVFVAYAIDKAPPIDGPTKLQATIFLLELKLKENGLSGPVFKFVQSRKGPFSQELSDTLDEFRARGFVDKRDLSLTERGKFLRDLILPELRAISENEEVFATADSILQQCQRETGDSLLKEICNMSLRPEGDSKPAKVKALPPDKVLIAPDVGSLKIPKELVILFVQEFELSQEQIARAQKDWPETESRVLGRLRRAINEDQQA